MLKGKSTTKASDTERKLLLSSTSPLEEGPEEAVEGSGKSTLPQQSRGRRAGHGASGASCLARPTLLTPLICVVRNRSVSGGFLKQNDVFNCFFHINGRNLTQQQILLNKMAVSADYF